MLNIVELQATTDANTGFGKGTINIRLERTGPGNERGFLTDTGRTLTEPLKKIAVVVAEDGSAPDSTYVGEARRVRYFHNIGDTDISIVLEAPLQHSYTDPDFYLIDLENGEVFFKHFAKHDQGESNFYTLHSTMVSVEDNDYLFARRITGNKVSTYELSADAGAPVSLGLSFEALNSVSNRSESSNYHLFPPLKRGDDAFPEGLPFLFKQGEFRVPTSSGNGELIGSMDSFALNVNNSLDVRYYSDGTLNNNKANPTKIYIGERNITLNMQLRIAWDDTLEYDVLKFYDGLQEARTFAGVWIKMVFQRDKDIITISMPNPETGEEPSNEYNQQGLY